MEAILNVLNLWTVPLNQMDVDTRFLMKAVDEDDARTSSAITDALAKLCLREGPERTSVDRDADIEHVRQLMQAKVQLKQRQWAAYRRRLLRFRIDTLHAVPSHTTVLQAYRRFAFHLATEAKAIERDAAKFELIAKSPQHLADIANGIEVDPMQCSCRTCRQGQLENKQSLSG